MKLRGIDFGHVLDASGVRGWFGEGHSFHPFLRPFGLNFDGSTFVAKTTTLGPREGNASMRRDGITPRVLRQRAVRVNFRKGVVLNAFSLTGPGFPALLATGRWQRLDRPFFLSFMAIEESAEGSRREVREFVRLLRAALPQFSAPVGLQINYSCPNVHHREELQDFWAQLDEYKGLSIPLMVKLSITTPPDMAVSLARHPACDAICVSNTLPWGALQNQIDWNRLFGSSRSPLEHLGGGGLSGTPLLPLVADWVRRARSEGLTKPINAGGGIMRPRDVDVLVDAGASSVFVGSIAMLRGWRLQGTIRRANALLSARSEPDTLETLPALKRA